MADGRNLCSGQGQRGGFTVDMAEQAQFDQQQVALSLCLCKRLIDGGKGSGSVTRRHPNQMAKVPQGLGIVWADRKGGFEGLLGTVKLAKALQAAAKH